MKVLRKQVCQFMLICLIFFTCNMWMGPLTICNYCQGWTKEGWSFQLYVMELWLWRPVSFLEEAKQPWGAFYPLYQPNCQRMPITNRSSNYRIEGNLIFFMQFCFVIDSTETYNQRCLFLMWFNIDVNTRFIYIYNIHDFWPFLAMFFPTGFNGEMDVSLGYSIVSLPLLAV